MARRLVIMKNAQIIPTEEEGVRTFVGEVPLEDAKLPHHRDVWRIGSSDYRVVSLEKLIDMYVHDIGVVKVRCVAQQ